MPVYISLLRGVNVGGKVVRMQQLKSLYESLGLTDVTTYIQSGNVLFKANRLALPALSKTIGATIEKSVGFPVAVIIRTPAEMGKVIKANPFIRRKGIDEIRLYVTFLNSRPSQALVESLKPLAATSKDEYEFVGNEIHLHCPNGYGKTLLSNTFFEKHLQVNATTRNWKTVNTLFAMATAME